MDQRPSSYRSLPASSKPSGPSCVICFNIQSIHSIGTCDHPICYECSTTMRVLCDQKECPICRRILTKVIFTKDELDLFKNLEERSYPRYNKKYGIEFGDISVKNSFDQLLRCYCKKCYERPEFTAFEQLATHMERNHQLYACRLCVNNLKVCFEKGTRQSRTLEIPLRVIFRRILYDGKDKTEILKLIMSTFNLLINNGHMCYWKSMAKVLTKNAKLWTTPAHNY